VHELLHLAQLKGGELQLVEAQIAEDSPAVGKRAGDLVLPEGCSLFLVLRGSNVHPIRPDTVLESGDKVLAVSRSESEDALHRALIGDSEPADAALVR
jgi:Trk K+ transport system NAD-binding subunit